MSRTVRRTLAAVSAVLVVAVSGWLVTQARPSSSEDGASGDGGSGFITGLTMYSGQDRQAAPSISGTTLDGDSLSLADLRGHIVVINVWGSWCGPCAKEAPVFAQVSADTRAAGVRFLGIDTRDQVTAAKAFEDTYRIRYPSLSDPAGETLLRFNGIVPIAAVPSTVFVDPDGRIAGRVIGPIDESTLRGILSDLVKERQGSNT